MPVSLRPLLPCLLLSAACGGPRFEEGEPQLAPLGSTPDDSALETGNPNEPNDPQFPGSIAVLGPDTTMPDAQGGSGPEDAPISMESPDAANEPGSHPLPALSPPSELVTPEPEPVFETCGDGSVGDGEECEPPGEGACNSSCQTIACDNGRVDEGEECDPPNENGCSSSCSKIECGNERVDETEECDPPTPGRCDSQCKSVECGNGVVEEGEGCDPPSAGVCDDTCYPVGCGDGRVNGLDECDPPMPGVCDGQCRSIVCGNDRVDEGEECEPPGSSSCDSNCRAISCGNLRVDEGEECDPPVDRQCNAECLDIVCGDGRLDDGEACEPGVTPSCSNGCSWIDETGTVALFGFDTGLSGWGLYATSPERLFSGTRVEYDAQNGDRTPGVLRMSAPFDGSNQKIEVQVGVGPLNLAGKTIVARVRLASGLSSDSQNPGGIKLFAKAGPSYSYASGPWTNLVPGGSWTDVTLDCDAPILVPDTFDPSDVRQIGVELRAFSETTGVSPAVVYLDSVGY